MELSLFQATLFTGILLLLLGGNFLLNHSAFRQGCVIFLRSKTASYITVGIAGAWFLYKVLHLGKADFGDYKQYFFVVFGGAILLSFKYMPDFLSVRGLCALWLMLAAELLAPGYGMEPKSVYLPAIVYVFIALAMWLGISPYRLRDFFGWLHRASLRSRMLGASLAGYGAWLIITAFRIS